MDRPLAAQHGMRILVALTAILTVLMLVPATRAGTGQATVVSPLLEVRPHPLRRPRLRPLRLHARQTRTQHL